MKIIVRASAGFLFFIGVIVAILGEMDVHTAKILSGNGSEFSVSFSPFEIIPLICFYLWPWVVGVSLFTVIPKDCPMKLTNFKISILFPFIIITGLYVNGFFFTPEEQVSFLAQGGISLLIVSAVTFFICFFYTLYFIAKELKSVELKKEAKWADYSSTFFLLWFSPIGIWFIQPRINRIFTKNSGELI